jgi:hypothetical protein
MSLKVEKGSKQRSRRHCKAWTKAGGACQAPAVERGLCFFHAHPEKLATLGRQGGQKNRLWKADECLSKRPLKSTGEVSELLEETINRVRQGPFDLRAANAIGFLASVLLREKEPPFFCSASEAVAAAKVKCPLHGNRIGQPIYHIYVSAWRAEKEPARRQRLSAQYRKAWEASFRLGPG